MQTQFRILHCLRAPVGGLFRHVCDLAVEQSRLGHQVGVVCASTGDALTDARLDALAARLSLGVHRLPMTRDMGLGDARAALQVRSLARRLAVDVVHGHGAKGGAYARLAVAPPRSREIAPLCIYTPHGGSLHFDRSSSKGRVIFALERQLARLTDAILFESAYSAARYTEQVGTPTTSVQVIPNGVGPADFEPIALDADATDLLFVGELRMLKGVDVLLEALARTAAQRPLTATIVGDGPDASVFRSQADAFGIRGSVRFPGALPARKAFKMGRTLVVPSRAESFPYIVLEAGAARKPLITTRVGGIPEIIGDTRTPMLPPGDAAALSAELLEIVAKPSLAERRASDLSARIARMFTIATMSEAVLTVYGALLEDRGRSLAAEAPRRASA